MRQTWYRDGSVIRSTKTATERVEYPPRTVEGYWHLDPARARPPRPGRAEFVIAILGIVLGALVAWLRS